MKKINNPPKKNWDSFMEVEFFNTVYPKMIESLNGCIEKKVAVNNIVLLGFFSIVAATVVIFFINLSFLVLLVPIFWIWTKISKNIVIRKKSTEDMNKALEEIKLKRTKYIKKLYEYEDMSYIEFIESIRKELQSFPQEMHNLTF
ncbi:MAG TPA: hypothetical protein PLI39_00260 [Petrotogaceae bacterium]|nr:hypothetical protein [Petrotogaceae bacterium]HQO12596.1 hypothetical protein [Petrotogaceae bacterium]HQP57401.1 hypothetical protein [Petrotogaceae bacterium]